MNTMPFEGTIVKIVGGNATNFEKLFPDFGYKNEWEVLGVGRKTTSGESMVNIKNLHGIMGNQVMQFFKEELEELK